MDAEAVIAMVDEANGRERVALLNMQAANALYACLIQNGGDRVGVMAADLGVSVKTVYAWCANRATVPVEALKYCYTRFADHGCGKALSPDGWHLIPNASDAPATSQSPALKGGAPNTKGGRA